MDVFIARQPIFDRQERVEAYELLFRSGPENFFAHADPDQASGQVILISSLVMDMRIIGGGKPLFINATRDILTDGHLTMLPPELTVVEVLENVEPDPEVVAACRRLKEAGYLLALDDFVYHRRLQPLLELADIVKVDVLDPNADEWRVLARDLGKRGGVRLLAEKVETQEVFAEARDLGYSYFQGYFFRKPQMISARDVPAFRLNYLTLLKQIHRPEMDFKEIEGVIKREMSLCYRLLRYINSAYFGLKNKVSSLMHAMTLLGQKEFKKWASLVILAGMAEDKPDELVMESLVRARFCEVLGGLAGLAGRANELFLMGMFSLIDAILARPLAEVLEDLPIGEEVKEALLGGKNRLRDVYEYVLAYQAGDWERLSEMGRALDVEEERVPRLYLQAVEWAHATFREVGRTD